MGFSRKLQYFLVHQSKFTNAEAKALIAGGCILLNGQKVTENVPIKNTDEVSCSGTLLQAAKKFRYIKFYKPRGRESTLSPSITENIRHYFKNPEDLIIAGRLDKESEGLLILSNDGQWVESICNPSSQKEKEYIVSLDRMPSNEFTSHFRTGVLIGGSYTTKSCICDVLDGKQIRVVLTEGKNRQIRRMCHKLGYGVLKLQRIRIHHYLLEDLKAGQQIDFEPL